MRKERIVLLNRRKFRRKFRRIRKDLTREWAKFTQNDLHNIEDELDRIVELFEKRYGYSSEQAIEELERYVQTYGKRTREVLNEELEQLREKPKRALPLLWGVMAVIGAGLLLMRFRSQDNATE